METSGGDFFISQNRAEGCDEDLSDIIEIAERVRLSVETEKHVKV